MATQCTNQYRQLPPPYTKKENDNEFSSIDSGFCESNEMSYSMDVDCKYAEDLPGVNILDRGQGGDASLMLPSHKKKNMEKNSAALSQDFTVWKWTANIMNMYQNVLYRTETRMETLP